jgi:hypothetical protein
MTILSVDTLIPVLQVAVSPVILISGVGLLLLTMTNRYGRVIDRVRILVDSLHDSLDEDKAGIKGQVYILWRRARLIRSIIALSSISALAAAFLIIFLFITALWGIETVWIMVLCFVICMVSLILSLILFIYDINQSLSALKLELKMEGITKD